MKRALLLVNPKARNAANARSELSGLLEAQGISVIETSERDPGLYCELIERFKEKIDLVVVAGGDGSCLCVAQKLQQVGLPLGVIPLGTANNLARSLSIPSSLKEAVRLIGLGTTRKVDLGLVNGKPFLNVTGMGLSTQVNRWVPGALKRRWGVFAYAIYLLKVARRITSFRAEITCEGKTQSLRSLQITVCNGRHYGSGLTIHEDASIDDHCLDLLSLHPQTWWQAIRLLPKLKRGRYSYDSTTHILKGKRIRIETFPILSVDTDGEVTTKTPLEFDILPEALSVFSPV